MKAHLALLTSLVSLTALANQEIPLWPNGAPGALGKEPKDIPTLTLFLPNSQEKCAAMVVCPGGGYGGLASHEGKDYALWLNEQGIAAFVLKYRLGPGGYHHPTMLGDVSRAMRTVRARADEWNLDIERIGIIGSSAGGHLASTLLTHFDSGNPDATDPIDRQSSRPALGVLCYAVITMDSASTHGGSRKNLLGDNPSPELVRELSNQLHVTKDTPPCFVWATAEDKAVPAINSIMFGEALTKAGVPFELHIYEKGAHGLGLGSRTYDRTKWHRWTYDCNAFLIEHNFATRWLPPMPMMPRQVGMDGDTLRAIPPRETRALRTPSPETNPAKIEPQQATPTPTTP